MSWRFRHSFKVIPGVRLNLSGRGLSCTIGHAPFTVNIGPHGVHGTASLPGTGISYRTRLDEPTVTPPHAPPPGFLPIQPQQVRPRTYEPPKIEVVKSASTELLTSESLKELKRVIQTAHEERESIEASLRDARVEKARASERYLSWQTGFFFKRLFKGRFARRKSEMETAQAKTEELEQQLNLTTVNAHLELAKAQAEPYFCMRDQFASLSECASIWDIKWHQATDKFHERTTANSRVNREKVKFSLDRCDLIQWDQRVPHLRNAKGGELFLYPGFILYRTAREAFSVIGFHDVKINWNFVNFQEEETVPPDTVVIGQTWAKANKDGSRDRRFVNNRPLPIVRYMSVALKSETGLWEEFQFSNVNKIEYWIGSWFLFVNSYPA